MAEVKTSCVFIWPENDYWYYTTTVVFLPILATAKQTLLMSWVKKVITEELIFREKIEKKKKGYIW